MKRVSLLNSLYLSNIGRRKAWLASNDLARPGHWKNSAEFYPWRLLPVSYILIYQLFNGLFLYLP